MINQFSNEVIDQIGYYVYRLIDPRDGQTFYVGKGQGNRLFAHMNIALENYNNKSYLSKEDNKDNLKISRIHEIKDAGLDVIHVIQRWNLTEKEAFLVESTLIDAYGFNNLSNKVKGHEHEYGVCNAETLERDLSCAYYEDTPDKPKYMIIKTQTWRVNEVGRDYATRHCWPINTSRVKEYPYVLSVTNGVVREVYKVDKWTKVPGNNRYEFEGEKAEDSIRNIFINKKIPEKYKRKGMARPVLYSNLD